MPLALLLSAMVATIANVASVVAPDAVVSDDGECSSAMTSSAATGACFTLDTKQAQLPTLLFIGVQKCATTSVALQMLTIFDELRACGLSTDNVEKHFFDSPNRYEFPQVILLVSYSFPPCSLSLLVRKECAYWPV